MDTILWSIGNADAVEVLGRLWRPFLISMVLYFSGYFAVWFQTLARVARIRPPFRGLTPTEAVDVLVVIPTLVRSASDLDDLRDAAATVVSNGYPGKVVLVMSIDGADDQPAVVGELERWALAIRDRMTVFVARVPRRAGKGVAVAAGSRARSSPWRPVSSRACHPCSSTWTPMACWHRARSSAWWRSSCARAGSRASGR